MELSQVIARVQKLLALSTSNNANEAAAAANAANKLIDEYRLTQADLQGVQEETPEEDTGFLYQTGRVTKWKERLISVLTKHYGVAYWNNISWETGRQFSRFKMVGRKSDMEIVKYMYTWLSAECERLSALEAKGTGLGRVFVSSYQEGFVVGIANQLATSRAEIRKTAANSALVKLDSRWEESRSLMHKLHELRSSKSTSQGQLDTRAFGMGMQRGESIHLGAALGEGGKPVRLLK